MRYIITIILLLFLKVSFSQDTVIVNKLIKDTVYVIDGDSCKSDIIYYDKWIDSVSNDTLFRFQKTISADFYETKRVRTYLINKDTLILFDYKSKKKEKKDKKNK